MKTFADRHDEGDKLRRKKSQAHRQEEQESASDAEIKRLAEGPSQWLQRSIDRLQAKLEVSQPEDASEVQAEEVAEAFMRGDSAQAQHALSQPASDIAANSGDNRAAASAGFEQQLQNSKGQGQKLDDATRDELEEHTSADLGDVNIHNDRQAHELSESINAIAFAHGEDIYFTEGNYNSKSEEGRKLLAHEVAHTVQAASKGNSLQAQKLHKRGPGGSSILSLLNSENITTRKKGLDKLDQEDSKEAWQALIISIDSQYDDVKTKANEIVSLKIKNNSGFKFFLDELVSSPQGYLSDLAIRILIDQNLIDYNIASRVFSTESYRVIVKERLIAAKEQAAAFAKQLNAFNREHPTLVMKGGIQLIEAVEPATAWYDAKLKEVASMSLDSLNAFALKLSDVEFQQGQILELINYMDNFPMHSDDDPVSKKMIARKRSLLEIGYQIDGNTDFKNKIAETYADISQNVNIDYADGLMESFGMISTELAELKKTQVLDPYNLYGINLSTPHDENLQWENDTKIKWVGKATEIPYTGQRDILIGSLQSQIYDLSRDLNVLKNYALLNKTEEYNAWLQTEILPVSEKLMLKYIMIANAGSIIMLWNQLAIMFMTSESSRDKHFQNLRWYCLTRYASFIDAAHTCDSDPHAVMDWYSSNKERLTKVGDKKIDDELAAFNKDYQEEYDGLMFLFDIVLIIFSILTMNPAGFAVRGLLSSLSMRLATSVMGRLAVFLGKTLAFHTTYKFLRSVAFDEEFYGESFWQDYAETTVMFAVLSGAGKFYERALGPKLDKLIPATTNAVVRTGLKAGAQHTYTFLAFQAWATGAYVFHKNEFPSWEKQFEMAKHNAALLGAIHIGMKLASPFSKFVDSKTLKYWEKQHQASCDKLKRKLDNFMESKNYGEKDQQKKFLKECRAAAYDRIDIYKEAKDAKSITEGEYQGTVAVMNEYISSINRILSSMKVDMYSDQSGANIIYYRGKRSDAEESFRDCGYAVSSQSGQASFTTTIDGIKYRVIQANSQTTVEVVADLKKSIREIVARAGFDFVETQQSFGIADAGKPGDEYAVEAEINMVLYNAWVDKNWRPGQPVPEEYEKKVAEYNRRKRMERNRNRLFTAYGKMAVEEMQEAFPASMEGLIDRTEEFVQEFTTAVTGSADFLSLTRAYHSEYPTLQSVAKGDRYYELTTPAEIIVFIPTAAIIGKMLSEKLKADVPVAEAVNRLLEQKDASVQSIARAQIEQPGITEFVQEMNAYTISPDAVLAHIDVLQKPGESGNDLRARIDQLVYNSEAPGVFYKRVFDKPLAELKDLVALMDGETIRVQTASGHVLTLKRLTTKGEATDLSGGELGMTGEAQLLDVTRNLDDPKEKNRSEAMRDLRKGPGDKKDRNQQLEGAIFTPLLEAQIRAISELRNMFENEALGGVDLVMAFDRGGTLILDQLDIGKFVSGKIIKVEKPDNVKSTNKFQRDQLKLQVESLMESDPNKKARIFFTEEFVSGTETKEATKVLRELLKEYPNLEVDLFLLQQTKQTSKPDKPGDYLLNKTRIDKYMEQGRFDVHYVQVPFIIGADVDYQANTKSTGPQHPIPVFGIVNGKLQAFLITPDGATTARDIIIDMDQGQLKGKIGNIH